MRQNILQSIRGGGTGNRSSEDLPSELGGIYYLQTQFGKKEGIVPEVDLEAEKKVKIF